MAAKQKHPTAPYLYQYRQGVVPQADSVLSLAFDWQNWHLPVLLFRGAGRVAGALAVVAQAPQPWAPLAVPTSSFGGSQAGIFEFAPLLDTTGDTAGE